MIDANVSPAEALDTLAAQTQKAVFREKIYKIAEDVRSGTLLSKAFSKYPEIFSSFMLIWLNQERFPEICREFWKEWPNIWKVNYMNSFKNQRRNDLSSSNFGCFYSDIRGYYDFCYSWASGYSGKFWSRIA